MAVWLKGAVLLIALMMKGQVQHVSEPETPLAVEFNETFSIKLSTGKHKDGGHL